MHRAAVRAEHAAAAAQRRPVLGALATPRERGGKPFTGGGTDTGRSVRLAGRTRTDDGAGAAGPGAARGVRGPRPGRPRPARPGHPAAVRHRADAGERAAQVRRARGAGRGGQGGGRTGPAEAPSGLRTRVLREINMAAVPLGFKPGHHFVDPVSSTRSTRWSANSPARTSSRRCARRCPTPSGTRGRPVSRLSSTPPPKWRTGAEGCGFRSLSTGPASRRAAGAADCATSSGGPSRWAVGAGASQCEPVWARARARARAR